MTAKNRQRQRRPQLQRQLQGSFPFAALEGQDDEGSWEGDGGEQLAVLFSLVGGLEVLAGGVGLGLVATGLEDLLVHVDGVRALVEEVVHLSSA